MGLFSNSKGKECLSVRGASGATLSHGSRVQTVNDEGSDADGKWYVGTVVKCWDKGYVKIEYDDPDDWEGEAKYVHALPPGHPGHNSKVMVGADSPAGPGQPMMQPGMMPGQPMGQPMMMAAQPMMTMPAQPMMMPAQPMGGVVMGQPMMPAQPMAMPTAPPQQPQLMTVQATVPGGQSMAIMHNGQQFNITVPMGVQPGQSFQFQL